MIPSSALKLWYDIRPAHCEFSLPIFSVCRYVFGYILSDTEQTHSMQNPLGICLHRQCVLVLVSVVCVWEDERCLVYFTMIRTKCGDLRFRPCRMTGWRVRGAEDYDSGNKIRATSVLQSVQIRAWNKISFSITKVTSPHRKCTEVNGTTLLAVTHAVPKFKCPQISLGQILNPAIHLERGWRVLSHSGGKHSRGGPTCQLNVDEPDAVASSELWSTNKQTRGSKVQIDTSTSLWCLTPTFLFYWCSDY